MSDCESEEFTCEGDNEIRIKPTHFVRFAEPKPVKFPDLIDYSEFDDDFYVNLKPGCSMYFKFATLSDSDQDDWDADQETHGTRCRMKPGKDYTEFEIPHFHDLNDTKAYMFSVNKALFLVCKSKYEARYMKIASIEGCKEHVKKFQINNVRKKVEFMFLDWLENGCIEIAPDEEERVKMIEGFIGSAEAKSLYRRVRTAEIFIHDLGLDVEVTWDHNYDIVFENVQELESYLLECCSKYFKNFGQLLHDFGAVKLDADNNETCYWCINVNKRDFKPEYQNGRAFVKTMKNLDIKRPEIVSCFE
jgi:hypothetical protein